MTVTKSISHRTPAKRVHGSEPPTRSARSKPAKERSEAGVPERLAAPEQEKPNGATTMTAEEIRVMISDAAYMKAQARNFEPGHELDDWYAAEAEIKERLAGSC